ncbi:MarR family winged helix-turn-helix transcriptional regulator [Heyndrickxia sp. NPDC080065]|uniref:MarR family winged helix-turn-helix transcriptional regulator n=1 Tax=Heyndrickxia sp. NPDC080065 TaxID=3390568 RepID=UPI003D05DC91
METNNISLEKALTLLQCELVAARNKINPKKVTWNQYDILETLYLFGDKFPAMLSTELGQSRSTISKNLKILKDYYYIQQQKNEKDGREVITQLTHSGNEFMEEIKSGHEKIAEIAASVLTPEEQITFSELCSKVSKALYENRNKVKE